MGRGPPSLEDRGPTLTAPLSQCPVLSLQDAVKGLFVCSMFLDFVSLSQRLIPELLNFLLGILYIAAPDKQGQGEPGRGARAPNLGALQRCLSLVRGPGDSGAEPVYQADRSLRC